MKTMKWLSVGFQTPHSSRNTPAGRQGFSLIELLVVIAIIALLLSLITPVVSGMRRNANSVRAQSDLRQIGAGVLEYAGDHQGKLPYGKIWKPRPGGGRGLVWADLIAEYTGYDVFVNSLRRTTNDPLSPVSSWEIGPYDPITKEVTLHQVTRRLPYGYNTTWLSPGMEWWGYSINFFGRKPERRETYVHDCVNPAKVFMVADSHVRASGWSCSIWYGHRTQNQRGVYGFNNGKANLVFVDGHVKALPADQVNGTGQYSGVDADNDGIEDAIAFWNPNPKSWTN